ncbi:hypothetical protein ACNKHL_12910 [Shigella flexneri]
MRYYYTAKLFRALMISIQPWGFVQRVNADIVNKVVNLASLNAGLIQSCLTACWQANWLTVVVQNLH